MTAVAGTHKVRYAYSGEFNVSGLNAHLTVTVNLAAGAVTDGAGNTSAASSMTFTVRKPATTFFINLAGGVTLNGAGFTTEPLLDVRGYVNFEAKTVVGGTRFQLDFGGTLKVIYLGNLGSAAGVFVLDTSTPAPDGDVLTVRELFADMGVAIGAENALGDIKLPKLWGVVKVDTNLEFLKNIGIDAQLSGVLQVNTTKVAKVETLTLEGMPGDLIGPSATMVNPDSSAVSSLNSGKLTSAMLSIFSSASVTLGAGYEVRTVVSGSQWRVIDSVKKKQYFIQLQKTGDIAGATFQNVLNFRGETQQFTLSAKTLLIAGYAYAKFTIGGSQLFAISGAFSIKLSTTSIQLFADGSISFTPGGVQIFEARVQALVLAGVIPLSGGGSVVGLAGKFKLGASLTFPGVSLAGSLDVLVNTTSRDITWDVTPFLRPIVGYNTVTISGHQQKLNAAFNPNAAGGLSAGGSAIIDDTSLPMAPYVAIGGIGHLNVLNTMLWDGAFFFSISSAGIQLRVLFRTTLQIPSANIKLFEMNGAAALYIDLDGVYGRAELTRSLDLSSFPVGFTFNASFVVELNATLKKKTFTYSSYDASLNVIENTMTLGGGWFRIASHGSLAFTLGSGEAARLEGDFEFVIKVGTDTSALFSDTYFQITASADAYVAGANVGHAAGGIRIGVSGLVAFIQIQIGGGTSAPGGNQELTGSGFEIKFSLAFYLNTTSATVTLAGVPVPVGLTFGASGYVQLSLAGVAGFRIEGSVLVQVNGSGYTVTVAGSLVARALGVTLFSGSVNGVLHVGTDGLYAALDVSLESSGQITGVGYVIGVNTIRLDINLTGNAQTAGAISLSAGFYARIRIEGYMAWTYEVAGVTIGGYYLDNGVFYMEVGSNGLYLAAVATLKVKVFGVTVLSVAAQGMLYLGAAGIAAKIRIDVNTPLDCMGGIFSFTGSFYLVVNTTGQDVLLAIQTSTQGTISLNVPGAEYLELKIDGTLKLLSVLSLDGHFLLKITDQGLEMQVVASMIVAPLGTLAAGGSLYILSDGLAGSLALTASSNIGFSGIAFHGSFQLAVNTTPTEKVVQVLDVSAASGTVAGLKPATLAATSLYISFGGTLEVGPFSIKGGALLLIDAAGIEISFDASMDLALFGSLSVRGGAIIRTVGGESFFVLYIDLGAQALGFGLISITGNFTLKINTSSSARTIDMSDGSHQTIGANTFLISVAASIKIWVFEMRGTIVISKTSDYFEIAIQNFSVNFFNVVTLYVNGYIRSNGQFEITGRVTLNFDFGPFYFHAGIELTLANWGFRGHVWGSLGISVDIGLFSFDVTLGGVDLVLEFRLDRSEIYASGTFTVLIFSISGSITWSFGHPPILSTKIGSVLYLNVGV
ncbi:MAG: hypothetical protein EBS01_06790, partial [Verrucomicrobia bacterium]|nr:hypothetical protein [Verrucomicrobiota bacterium]